MRQQDPVILDCSPFRAEEALSAKAHGAPGALEISYGQCERFDDAREARGALELLSKLAPYTCINGGFCNAQYVTQKLPYLMPASALWTLASIVATLFTGFGGGTAYTIIMKWSGPWTFAWMNLRMDAMAVAGCLLHLALTALCTTELSGEKVACVEVLASLTRFQMPILIAQGVNKSYADSVGRSPAMRIFLALFLTFVYSLGGGLMRDMIFIACGERSVTLGNLSSGMLLPTLGTACCYHALLLFRLPPFVQVALGLPAATSIFYALHKFAA